MIVFYATLLALAIVVCAFGAKRIAKDTRRLEKYELYSKNFYIKAGSLASDEDSPAEILNTIGFISRYINKSRYHIFLVAIVRQWISQKRKDAQRNEAAQVFVKNRPELARAFNQACCAGLLAITYRSRLFGPIVRRLLGPHVKHMSEVAVKIAGSAGGPGQKLKLASVFHS